jgi:hypothetical protein
VPPCCSAAVREALQARVAAHHASAVPLPAFALLGLKLEADQWLEGGEPRLKAELADASARWMGAIVGRHSDYEFYRAAQ